MVHSEANDLEAIRLEYRSSLADLTFNSKPIITNLTIIAQENLSAASAIVQAIEDQMRNAQPKQKLPVLYLLDSICKNVGGVYISLFARNVVRVFSSAYQAVDKEDKLKFQRVLNTWKNHPPGPIFSHTTLAQIEALMFQSPSSGAAGRRPSNGSIHVNPNFMARQPGYPQNTTQVAASRNLPVDPRRRPTPYDRPQTGSRKDYSQQKQDRSLNDTRQDSRRSSYDAGRGSHLPPVSHAQHGRSPLLAQAMAAPMPTASNLSSAIFSVDPVLNQATVLLQQQLQTLLAQKQSMALLNPGDPLIGNQIHMVNQLLELVRTTPLDASSIQQITQEIQNMFTPTVAPVPVPGSLGLTPMSAPLAAIVPTPAISQYPTPPQVFPSVSTSGIAPATSMPGLFGTPMALDGLLDTFKWGAGAGVVGSGVAAPAAVTGITNAPAVVMSPLVGAPAAAAAPPALTPATYTRDGIKIVSSVKELPKIRLCNEDINKSYPTAITILYDALDLQCKQCGTRYVRSPEGKSKMDAHLDWHFRQNRRAKEKGKKAVSREWMVGEEEWVKEQEGDVRDRQAPTVFFETSKPSNAPNSNLPPPPPVSNIPADNTKEARCAICHEDLEKFYDDENEEWMLRGAVKVDGVLYHQTCHMDFSKPKSPTAATATSVGGSPTLKRKSEDASPPAGVQPNGIQHLNGLVTGAAGQAGIGDGGPLKKVKVESGSG
ncbi:hypothetical protein HK104_001590 [Borealophlyctis nickersoniae]|nr:hypothetical protein HK104_001590 [Borealophlyctis nickersoniae]